MHQIPAIGVNFHFPYSNFRTEIRNPVGKFLGPSQFFLDPFGFFGEDRREPFQIFPRKPARIGTRFKKIRNISTLALDQSVTVLANITAKEVITLNALLVNIP